MSAAMQSVTANARSAHGKGPVRRLRKEGQIPAVAYGKDLAATPLAVGPKDIISILKTERGQNTVIQMKVDGAKDLLVMIKDFTYHPVTRALEHVDFVEVKLDRPVDVAIPLNVHGKAAGVVKGGLLRQVFRTLPIRCVPDRIPLHIDVDVSELDLGGHIATQNLTLPEGVEVRLPPEQTLVSIVAPEKDRNAEEAAAAPGAPAAAAPAGKGGKAAAAPKAAAAAPAAKKK